MNILALDLGTKTGWSWRTEQNLSRGTWQLATPKEIKEWGITRMTRRCDPRVERLAENLKPFVSTADLVVFEDVQFSSFTMQCQLWASLRTVVWMKFGDSGTFIDCVPVSTLKKFATGHGGATKEMMREAAYKIVGSNLVLGCDDNAIDAFWIDRWTRYTFGRVMA